MSKKEKMSDADRNVNGNKQADENNNLEKKKSDADKNMDENKENDKKATVRNICIMAIVVIVIIAIIFYVRQMKPSVQTQTETAETTSIGQQETTAVAQQASSANDSTDAKTSVTSTAETEKTAAMSQKFSYVDCIEEETGLKVASLYLPEGWTVQTTVISNVVDTKYPLLGQVIASSPENDIKICYLTPMRFIEQDSYTVADGVKTFVSSSQTTDYVNYVQLMPLMNADEMAQTRIKLGFADSDTQLILENKWDSAKAGILNSALDKYCSMELDDIKNIYSAENFGEYSSTYNYGSYRYKVTDENFNELLVEAMSIIDGNSYVYDDGETRYEYIDWQSQPMMLYCTYNESSFSNYYNAYKTILANSYVTSEFFYVDSSWSARIQNTITESQTEALTESADDRKADVLAYETGSDYSNERPEQLTDGAIPDTTPYTCADGSKVYIDNGYKYVYETGDGSIYASPEQDGDSTYTLLKPAQ